MHHRTIPFLFALAALGPGAGIAAGQVGYAASSLEWLVADADVVARGVVVDVTREPAREDRWAWDVVMLDVREVLKGGKADRLTFVVYTHMTDGTVARWKEARPEGLWFLWRQGELQLAWRCPRLDRLGVRLGAMDAPWEALRAADGAMDALDEASTRFPDFFPEGRRDLLKAVYRTLETHRRHRRTMAEALQLPDGLPRRGLERRAQQAGEELSSLTMSFGEIRSRLVETASTPRCEEGEALLGSLQGEGMLVYERMLQRFEKDYETDFVLQDQVSSGAAGLPFVIVQIIAGPRGHLVMEDGRRLHVGDKLDGLRLVRIDNERILFDGVRRYEVAW